MTIYEPTTERRCHPRTHLSMSVPCIRLDPDCGDVTDRIDVVDISRGGLGAICQRPFYPGQRVILCLPRATGGHRSVYASIVRCRHRTEGYRVGLQFDHATISAWMDADVQTAAA